MSPTPFLLSCFPHSSSVFLCALCALCGEFSFHPVPKDNHDRDIAVRLTPDAVLVDYLLEVDETRAIEDTPRDELAGVTTKAEFYAAVLRVYAAALGGNLDATLDGKPLDFACVQSSYTSTDSLRCRFHFKAPWRPAPGAKHAFTFAEANYFGDEVSRLRLTLGAEGRVTLEKWAAPDEALMARPALDRKPGDGERLRKASATFTLAPEEPRATAKLAVAPDVEAREPPGLRAGRVAAVKRRPDDAVAWDKPGPGPTEDRAAGAAAEAERSQTLLDLLLDTQQGIATLLLLAALFGAAHALTPGHGKTLVAAYLVGERGTVGHAILLGVVTTLTHTAAVLVLAALLPVWFADTPRATVQAGLELVGGLLIAGLGLWLLLQRLSGRADHVHLGGGHHHHHHHGHDHSHDHVHAPPPAGWRGLVALGVQGGIVPCWDAIAMLGVAVTAGKLWLALPLLLAFSAGLASVLVGLGVGVVSARNLAVRRWGGWKRLAPLGRALPLVSAAVLTGMGLWLCYDSLPH
jgi:ABC-type nickel/cobalt efflux system permease component RcnA